MSIRLSNLGHYLEMFETRAEANGVTVHWGAGCARAQPDRLSDSQRQGCPASAVGCDFSRAFAHPAFCAHAILRREAADIIRVGWFTFPVATELFNDSITEIA